MFIEISVDELYFVLKKSFEKWYFVFTFFKENLAISRSNSKFILLLFIIIIVITFVTSRESVIPGGSKLDVERVIEGGVLAQSEDRA